MSAINDPDVGGATIHCAICINLTGRMIPAATIIDGYATCTEHAELLSQPFSNMAELIRRIKTNLTEQAT